MKIMQILPRMNVGGVERGVVDAVSFFKKRNAQNIHSEADVDNIVVSSGGRLVEGLLQLGVKHYKLPVAQKSPLILWQIPKLRRILQKDKVSVVHARSRMPGWVSFFASRGSCVNFVTTAHGIYKSKFFSEVMGWGKYVICPSKVVARHMKDNFGVPEEKIVVISRWVNLEEFTFKDYSQRKNNIVIAAVGRISPTKGYEHLIKGFKKVVRFNPYLKLKIIGSADKSKAKYLEHLKMLVNRCSLNYNVEFVGFELNIGKVLEEARILVAPSVIEESFGRVVVEGFACGVPVIATDMGGFKEIIDDGKDAILVEPKNSEQIADSILKLLNNPDYAAELVKNARKKVESKYVMDRCLMETKEVYERAINDLRILIVKISSLGDLVLVLPSLEAIRKKFPKSKISLLTLKKYRLLFHECPYVDEIIVLGENYKTLRSLLNIVKHLRRKSFDYLVDLQNSRTSHLISFLSFPRYSFGYNLRWGWLIGKKAKYERKDSPLKSQEKILQLLGVKLIEKRLIFWEKKGGSSFSLPDAQFIGINVSGSKKWESKSWPFKNTFRLIELINKNLSEFKVVLFGDVDAQVYAQKIERSIWPHPINLCGKTNLADLPKVMKKMKVFITPDTATLHLALALEVSTIGLFGPTDPQRHAVKGKNLHIFVKKMKCSYCYQSKCSLERANVCMSKISSQEVFVKIREILRR